MTGVDDDVRATVAAIDGRAVEPYGRSIHLHQLDGARTEAMIFLDAAGTRIDWVHGKGDCAVTGEGAAILDVLNGRGDPDALQRDGRLALYGDRELIGLLPSIFLPR